MNIHSGVFTAPRSGTYHFSFAFMNDEQAKAITLYIRKNGVTIGAAHTDALSKTILQSSLAATLKLKSGDTVDLFQTGEGNLYDDASHYTHFTGWLIEEDLDKKLISIPIPNISTIKLADPLCQVKGFPRSCNDLRCRGQVIDGYYLVRSVILDNKIDIVYCEFSKSSSTPRGRSGLSIVPMNDRVFMICFSNQCQIWKQDLVT